MSAFTLSQYLREQKTRFLEEDAQGWTIVMGNEAGDLDTLASSIAYAWYQSQTDGKTIALMPMSRADFVLREENTHALALAGITSSFDELLCPEDLSTNPRCTSYALVDHNTLHGRYSSPDARVTAIIDHHEDEGNYHDTASPRIIGPSGSCASLVTGLFMSRFIKGDGVHVPPELASLLLSAIAIDTHGLRKDGKALDVDREAASWLFHHIQSSQESASAQVEAAVAPVVVEDSLLGPEGISEHQWIRTLASTLSSKKHAISHLSTRDLLRRDYKQYPLELASQDQGGGGTIQAGLATVPLPLCTYFSSGSTTAVDETVAWMEECGLLVLGVLTTYGSRKGDRARREELWIVNERVAGREQRGLARTLFDGLEADKALQLRRAKFSQFGVGGREHSGKNRGCESESDETQDEHESDLAFCETGDDSPFKSPLVARVYKQRNTNATRKQIAPVLKRILGG